MTHRIPMIHPRWRAPLALLLTWLGLWVAATAQQPSAIERDGSPAGVSIFLVRHAEKASDDARDPDLTEAGRRRAAELDRMLSDAGVTHLFSTDYRRTRQTLQPIAERTELEVRIYDPRQPAPLLDGLRQLDSGSVALVAGHSNTVPALFAELAGEQASDLVDSPQGPQLADSTYDRLFLVTLGDGPERRVAGALELRYGARD